MGSEAVKKRVLVVLGMPRSGTSLLANLVNEAGIDLGQRLLAADRHNKAGYWEDADIVKLHDDILETLDRGWFTPKSTLPYPDGWWRMPEVQEIKHQIMDIVATHVNDAAGMWGFKDHRTARLLPLWQEIFRESSLDPIYLLTIRNPAAVTASIVVRDGIRAEQTQLSWLLHNLDAIRYARGKLRLVVEYDRWFTHFPEQCGRLIKAVEFVDETYAEALIDRLADSVKADLCHQTRDSMNLLPYVQETFEFLKEVAAGKDVPPGLDGVQEAVQKAQTLLQSWVGAIDDTEILKSERSPRHLSRNAYRAAGRSSSMGTFQRVPQEIMVKERTETNSIKVAVYSFDDPTFACGRLRLCDPLAQLQRLELKWGARQRNSMIDVNEHLLETADLVVIQRFFPSPATRPFLERVLAMGIPVVYELDDLLTEPPLGNPHYEAMRTCRDEILWLMECVDAVVVSTEALRESYYSLNPRVRVLPNLLDERIWIPRVPEITDRPVRIGFAGTPTHRDDLYQVEDALEGIASRYGDGVAFVFMGCATERMKALPNAQYVEFDVGYEQYAKTLADLRLDIALAPLADNSYNRCKSNIKWLEYSMCGAAGVYSDLRPYSESVRHGETGMLVSPDPTAWFEAIDLLIHDQGKRRRIVERAQQEVQSKYTLKQAEHSYGLFLEEIGVRSADAGRHVAGAGAIEGRGTPGESAVKKHSYRRWAEVQALTEGAAQVLAERMINWSHKPAVHLLCAVQPGEEPQLADTLDSLGAQFYKGWGLSVISSRPAPEEVWRHEGALEWVHVEPGESMSAALARVIAETHADWVGLLEPGDRVAPNLLTCLGDYANRKPGVQLIYTDEDRIGPDGNHYAPRFKPDFNLDLLRSAPYFGAFVLIRRDALERAGGYGWLAEVGTYDVAFHVLEQFGEESIGHIPDVLFHRLQHNDEKFDRALLEQQAGQVLAAHLDRVGTKAETRPGYRPQSFNVEYVHEASPLVSIIIPTRDQPGFLVPCLDSLLEKTDYADHEVIVVDNGTTDAVALEYLEEVVRRDERVRVLRYPHPYNYSAINNMAAREARGEYLLLLNNDTVIVQEKWLQRMLAHAQRPEVGVVGARLVFPDQRLQHAGIVLGIDGTAHHPGIGTPLEEPGYMGRLQQTQNFSAVTGACLMVRKEVYFSVGGLDEKDFPILFNDIDLCLKAGKAGYKTVWTPYATVVHHGSGSLGGELGRMVEVNKTEQARTFVRKWASKLSADPAYNRNLTLRTPDWGLETQVTARWDVNFHDRSRVLAVPVDASGSPRYRVLSPLFALEREAYAQIGIVRDGHRRAPSAWEVARLEPDVLLLQMFVHDYQLAALQEYRALGGPQRIFALDDLVTNPPEWSPARGAMYPDIERRLRAALKLCDRLIVNTEPLREVYGGLIDDIRVVPNYLERKVWGALTSARRKGAKPRVGWAGAQQHQGDLELLLEVVQATAEEVDWVFMGMWLEAFRPYVKEFHQPVPFDEYPAKLAALDLDLAVAPLAYHPFNETKSNLRLLEYGALGWPVVCTDIEPYRSGPVCRVPNEAKAWIAAIRERVHDVDATASEGDRLREWVHGGWMLEDHLDEWLDALVGRSPVSLPRAAGSSGRQ